MADVRCMVSRSDGVTAHLTHSQCKILDEICTGLRDKEIAYELGRSIKTIRNTNHRIFAAMGVNTRMEAIIVALPLGFGRRPW